MNTLHYSIIAFLLVMIFFSDNTVFAQNQTQPTIEFDQASYATPTMSCNFYMTEKISAQDQEHSKVTIIVTNPSENKFSTSIDRAAVHVWSDSDKNGIEIIAYETDVNSGIFKGIFRISDGPSTEGVLHVTDGDTISAKYSGTTPWSPDTTSQGITTTAWIGISCPPLERVPASGINIFDNEGNALKTLLVNRQIEIGSNLTNVTIKNQTFAYIVQISDEHHVISLSSVSGLLLPSQTFNPSISWTPQRTGNYNVQIFVWQRINNPNALSPPLSTDLIVYPSIYAGSITRDVKNGQCHVGYELVIKPDGGSHACVSHETGTKLVKRGWGTFGESSLVNSDIHGKNGTLSGTVVLAGGPSGLAGPKTNYEVDVYAVDGITLVGKTFSDANAHYSMQLPAGNYTVYVPDYPAKQTHFVSVFPGNNTIFNIVYGTGYK